MGRQHSHGLSIKSKLITGMLAIEKIVQQVETKGTRLLKF